MSAEPGKRPENVDAVVEGPVPEPNPAEVLLLRLVQLNRALEQAKHLRRSVNRLLDRVVDGTLGLSEEERRRMTALSQDYSRRLQELGTVVKVVQPVTATPDGELPQKLRESYELLWIRTYGSGALYLGDPMSEKVGTSSAGWRASTSKEQHRGPASQGKSATAHRRHVVLDGKAYEQKRRIDKKLSRIATDIRRWLAGDEIGEERNVCTACGKIGDMDWRHCPSCGKKMERSR